MELAFQTTQFQFLRRIIQEVRFQEELSETIVPDSFPDIFYIIDCYAVPILRGKDCRDGSVTIAGGIKSAILYEPEDGTAPRKLELYLPFSVRFDHPELTAQSQVLSSILVRSVDARMINSRKAMIRINLGCEVTVYADSSENMYTLENDHPSLEKKFATYEITLPLETNEKSFVISDTLNIPGDMPPIVEIYKLHCRLEQTEKKLIGNKAVFKGILHCKCLYFSENESLHLYQQTVPFSQYCELRHDYDDETVLVTPVITGYDLEENLLSVNVLAQCIVFGSRKLTLLEDAYCTKGTLNAGWKEYSLETKLDQQGSQNPIRVVVSGDIKEILDADVYLDYPETRQQDDAIQIQASFLIRLLAYNNHGCLVSLSKKAEETQKLALSKTAKCRTKTVQSGDIFSAITPDGAEIRCTLSMVSTCCTEQKLHTLFEGSIEPEADPSQHPSLIIRRAPHQTDLWDLAKQYRSTERWIQAANNIEENRIPTNQMILIPIS